MKRRDAVLLVLLCVLFPLSLLFPFKARAFQLTYDGQKEFTIGTNLSIIRDSTANRTIYLSSWNFSQTLQLHFQGQDKRGYVKGFVTDDLTQKDQVFMDVNLGPFRLQWNKYNEGFLHPSWFDLDQKFRGLRLTYTGDKDETSFLGATGTNYSHEFDTVVDPGDENVAFGLAYPIVPGSVQAWLNGELLHDGGEYNVDLVQGTFRLLVPITAKSLLHVKYKEEGQDYLLFGGRYDRHVELKDPAQQLEVGLMFLQARDSRQPQNMLATEMFYRPKPWWTVELNGGIGQSEWRLPPVNPVEPVSDNPLTMPLLGDWRISNQFNWPNLNLSIDYQVVANRFLDLLNVGQEGRHLRLSGLYQGKQLLLKHQEDYHWDFANVYNEKQADLEVVWIDPHWVPYFYYTLYDWNGRLRQEAMAELGYQFDLKKYPGSLTYFGGVDARLAPESAPAAAVAGLQEKDSWQSRSSIDSRSGVMSSNDLVTDVRRVASYADIQSLVDTAASEQAVADDKEKLVGNIKPYLGVRYQRGPNQNFSARVYGKNGLELAQLEFNGNWEQGPVALKSRFKFLPEYYQIENNLDWHESPVDVNFKWVQSRYFVNGNGYVNLDLNLNLSELLQSEAELWLKLMLEQGQQARNPVYQLGFNKAIVENYVGYGTMSFGTPKKSDNSITLGVRQLDEGFERDLSLTHSGGVNDDLKAYVVKNKIAYSAGAPDYMGYSGSLEVDSLKNVSLTLDGEYPVWANLTVGAHYTCTTNVFTTHQLTVRTVYRF